MPGRSFADATAWAQVLAFRLRRQHLVERATPDRLADVARDLVGIHAQVPSAAELQLGARIEGIRVADVQDALWKRRALVRSWAFRNTLHLLVPDDLATFAAAAATRERWHDAAWLRYFGVDADEMEALIAAAGAILTDQPMTRTDLADAVARRLSNPALRERLRSAWGTYLGAPAQRGLLAFGPSDGRNVTFVRPSAWLGWPVAPSERADAPEPLDAMASLVARYLRAFPGASRDMVARWWGAARVGLVNEALARVPGGTAQVEIDGSPGHVLPDDVAPLAAAPPFRGIRLLPAFDPFVNELPRKVESVLPARLHDRVHRAAGWVSPVVLVDGRIGGVWQLAGGRRGSVEVVPFSRWRSGARRELSAEVERIGAFLGRQLAISIGPSVRS